MAETAVVARLKAVLTGDSAGLRRDLDQSSKRLEDFSKKAGAVGRKLTTGLTLPLVGVGAGAVKVAADFEKSMTAITALVGIAADEVKAMEGTVRSMATQFGKSGKEAADALFFITSAGLRGSVATDTLAASLKASAIGLGDTATIADLATSALNAYGADVLSAAKATDVMTATVREGKLEASELAGSMGRVLPLASAMGVGFNEVGAAFAALSRTGTNAAEAATQIRGILASLLRPTKQAEEALTDMGLSSEGLRRQMREEGLLETLKTLSEEFAGNEAAAASVFGNIRALSGVLDLMGANVATTEAIFASMADTTGAVDEAFAVVAQTASFQFQQSLAEVRESMLTLGQQLLPIVTDALETVTEAIRSVTGWFGDLDDGTKNALISLGGAAALMGPLALGIAGVSKALIALRAANPWVLGLTAAFAGLSIAVGAYFDRARDARDRQESLTQAFRDANDPATTVVDRLTAVAESMSLISKAEPQAEADFSEFMAGIVLNAEIAANGVTEAFSTLGAGSTAAIESFVDSGEQSFAAFTANASDAASVMANIENAALNGQGALQLFALDLYNSGEFARLTYDEMLGVLDAIDDTSRAQADHRKEVEATNKEYVTSGQVFEDFADILGTNVVQKYVAAAEASGDYTGALMDLQSELGYAVAELEAVGFGMTDVNAAIDEASIIMPGFASDVEGTARMLVAAGDAAGYDTEQIRALLVQMGLLDKLDPEIIIELGIEVTGGQSLEEAIRGLEEFYSQLAADIGMALPSVPAALQSLYDLRDALQSTAGRGGGGGGGMSEVADEIDEAARAAEQAQRELDSLSRSIANLGESLMGRDFALELFGASPDEIADIFSNLIDQMGDLGMLADGETADAMARLGAQFQAAAAAAQELEEATIALADAQAELERRQQVVADLRDEWAGFRDEFNLGGVPGAAVQTPLERILGDIDEALPMLRDAQAELARVTSERDRFQEQIRDSFAPALSPNTNVMGSTERILKQAREFRDNLLEMQRRGFPADVIQQVAGSGLAAGAKTSRHLLRMSQGEMGEFLAMRAEIGRLGAETAQIAASVVFGADVADAQGEVNRLTSIVDQLYSNAVAEAQRLADEQQGTVNALTDALNAATAQMETLVSNIQVNLFNAFNNFLSKLGGEVTRLTTAPIPLSVNLSAIDRLTQLIANVTGTTAPPPVGDGGGGGGGAPSQPPAPPAPPPEPTFTVRSNDGPISIIRALTGSTSGWASKAAQLWQHNGLFWRSSNDWQAIHPGQVLRVPALAKGGFAKAGMPHIVGEVGPELFVPDSSGYVIPNHMLGGMSGGDTYNITVNMPTGVDGEDVVKAIEKYTRRRGAVAMPTTNRRRF